ncbi:hypothetical protein BESB_005570 [Besnoitia besnoiti]|uniref:Uncharacterized protein n=1 Tax=Besnoitia besnoiti TaxID=94643 RepID=A0A2A9MPE8_BESBE|nr:hypothetical protein BESB_005570 [Besnoitia besnoiti]PFH38216.1 hypothetical protein BESB_005570 [Besnoitia besnoiti]
MTTLSSPSIFCSPPISSPSGSLSAISLAPVSTSLAGVDASKENAGLSGSSGALPEAAEGRGNSTRESATGSRRGRRTMAGGTSEEGASGAEAGSSARRSSASAAFAGAAGPKEREETGERQRCRRGNCRRSRGELTGDM